MEFQGKRVLVTGAGQGIGRLLAEALYDAGAEVHAVSKTASRLGSLAEGRDPARMRVYPQDVSRWAELKALLESMPVMHGLVNNAGTNILERAEDVTEETLDTILNTNLKSAINACQTVARRMRDSGVPGSIVNVSSQASLVGLENHLSYTASKAGMDGVTRVMAVEFGPNNIRTNSINPTVTLTPLGKAYWKGDRVEPMIQKIPLRKFAEPIDVVNTIMFLLSDKSSMVNGIVMPVDGGYTAK